VSPALPEDGAHVGRCTSPRAGFRVVHPAGYRRVAGQRSSGSRHPRASTTVAPAPDMIAAVLLILLMAALIAASFIAAKHNAELDVPPPNAKAEDRADDLIELPH
jgi:hypothetical protein